MESFHSLTRWVLSVNAGFRQLPLRTPPLSPLALRFAAHAGQHAGIFLGGNPLGEVPLST